MEICKAPTLQLKALNEHNVTHITYIEMEMLSAVKNKIVSRFFTRLFSLRESKALIMQSSGTMATNSQTQGLLGTGKRGKGGTEVGGEGNYIPTAILSPPE